MHVYQVTQRYHRDGRERLVDLDYAALCVAVRGEERLSGEETRRRLLAGEKLKTQEAEFYLQAGWERAVE